MKCSYSPISRIGRRVPLLSIREGEVFTWDSNPDHRYAVLFKRKGDHIQHWGTYSKGWQDLISNYWNSNLEPGQSSARTEKNQTVLLVRRENEKGITP